MSAPTRACRAALRPGRRPQPGGAPNLSGSLNLFRPYNVFDGSGSQFGGLAAGYNYRLPSRVVIGVEADVSFAG